jgi:small subunit ribosomal protein S16
MEVNGYGEEIWYNERRSPELLTDAQIGLLEPKYLPSGEQTENALKAVRFPTQAQKTVTDAVRQQRQQGQLPPADTAEGATSGSVAGTTSPQDPNAA